MRQFVSFFIGVVACGLSIPAFASGHIERSNEDLFITIFIVAVFGVVGYVYCTMKICNEEVQDTSSGEQLNKPNEASNKIIKNCVDTSKSEEYDAAKTMAFLNSAPLPLNMPVAKSAIESISQIDREIYGHAWLLIVGGKQRSAGFKMMTELSQKGITEASLVLAMFSEDQAKRKQLVKKAANAGNPEGMWQYSNFLPHSFCPNPNNKDDAYWESLVLEAAEKGNVDAMLEMGNVCHRREHFAESMYWYAMAYYNDHPEAEQSITMIAKKWKDAGMPRKYQVGSLNFDKARFESALYKLELEANVRTTVSMDQLLRNSLAGVALSGYIAGGIFETNENYEMAYTTYNMLANNNDPHGLKCYADMLITGQGVEQDIVGAFRMFAEAAEFGERGAMFMMGEYFKKENKNLAAFWYGLSHVRGYEYALPGLIQLVE